MEHPHYTITIEGIEHLVMNLDVAEFVLQSDLFPGVSIPFLISSKMPGKWLWCYPLPAPLDETGQPSYIGGSGTTISEALQDGLQNFLAEVERYHAREEHDFYWGEPDEDF